MNQSPALGLYRPRKELHMAGIAFVGSDANGQGLQNFNEVVLLRLGLAEPGEYVIFGRVVIRNDDGDGQNASARITTIDGTNLVDRADVRITGVRITGGGFSQTIHLQGTARVAQGQPVIADIRCSTFRGFASQSSLFALLVDQLRFD